MSLSSTIIEESAVIASHNHDGPLNYRKSLLPIVPNRYRTLDPLGAALLLSAPGTGTAPVG